MRISTLHLSPCFGCRCRLCNFLFMVESQIHNARISHICYLASGIPSLLLSRDIRNLGCQHHADLPYVFSVSSKLPKLIWVHCLFPGRSLGVWQATLRAFTMLLLREYWLLKICQSGNLENLLYYSVELDFAVSCPCNIYYILFWIWQLQKVVERKDNIP